MFRWDQGNAFLTLDEALRSFALSPDDLTAQALRRDGEGEAGFLHLAGWWSSVKERRRAHADSRRRQTD